MAPGTAFLVGAASGAAAVAAGAWLWDRGRSRRLGRFFSHAAHEINTPITAINMTVLNFLSGVFGEMPPDQAKWMEMMREQVGRLNGMVGELRDLIHLMLSRDLAMHFESAPPVELVEEVMALVRRGAGSVQGDIEISLPPDLPPVRVDRGRTVRTLASLVFHARKFRSGGPLRLGGESGRGVVTLSLRYSGQPMAAEEAASSLELLYPARAGHTLNAIGLGLGILRAVARRQGGDLGLSVEADGAAVLSLALPLYGQASRC